MLATGAPAPDFRLPDLQGVDISLETAMAGGSVLLVFFKISCPTCQLTLPFLERLHQSGKLAVFGISQDNAKDTERFNRSFGLTFPMLLDRREANYPASNAFQITNVPSLFLVRADRRIEWTLHGFDRKEMVALGERFRSQVFRPEDRVPEWKPG